MSGEIGIFVGRGEADDLKALECQRKVEGWRFASSGLIHADKPDQSIRDALADCRGKNVIINGLNAGCCVLLAAEEALQVGAATVMIEIENIRGGDTGVTQQEKSANIMAKRMTEEMINNPRLTVQPITIWERAKS